MKQRLENYLRKYLKTQNNIWWHKIQNSHYTATPADFIVLTAKKRMLIECKEIKGLDGRFSFDRLTQEQSLIDFTAQPDNFSYVMLLFWGGTLRKSRLYWIPIFEYLSIKNRALETGTHSLTFSDLQLFPKFEISTGNIKLTEVEYDK